jgi:hypothetical protein
LLLYLCCLVFGELGLEGDLGCPNALLVSLAAGLFLSPLCRCLHLGDPLLSLLCLLFMPCA